MSGAPGGDAAQGYGRRWRRLLHRAAHWPSWVRDCQLRGAEVLFTDWHNDANGFGYATLVRACADRRTGVVADHVSQPAVLGDRYLALGQKDPQGPRSAVVATLPAGSSASEATPTVAAEADIYGTGWLGPSRVWVWDAAVSRVRQRPIEVPLRDRTVPVDRDGLVRMVRLALGVPPLGPAVVPALLAEVARGRAGPTTRDLAERLDRGGPYCAGFRPKCRVAQPISLGALFTERCPHDGSTLPDAQP